MQTQKNGSRPCGSNLRLSCNCISTVPSLWSHNKDISLLTRAWKGHLRRVCDGVSQQGARGQEQQGPAVKVVTHHDSKLLVFSEALIPNRSS